MGPARWDLESLLAHGGNLVSSTDLDPECLEIWLRQCNSIIEEWQGSNPSVVREDDGWASLLQKVFDLNGRILDRALAEQKLVASEIIALRTKHSPFFLTSQPALQLLRVSA
jgi:hypothetical protein